MVNVVTDILIHRPVRIVAVYASNPDNAPTWYKNIKSVRWITSPPLSVGARIAFVAHFMGRELSYTYEVTEMSDNKFVMRTAEGPFPMETTYTWDAVDANTTRMMLENKGNPTGFSKLFSPFLKMMMKNANKKDLALLKRLLEND